MILNRHLIVECVIVHHQLYCFWSSQIIKEWERYRERKKKRATEPAKHTNGNDRSEQIVYDGIVINQNQLKMYGTPFTLIRIALALRSQSPITEPNGMNCAPNWLDIARVFFIHLFRHSHIRYVEIVRLYAVWSNCVNGLFFTQPKIKSTSRL